MARVDILEELKKLRTVLRYHIVTTFIEQVPTLFTFDVWYVFQTLILGEHGLIAFSSDDRWRVDIN